MQKPRSKPFERFGHHVLFKKIDSDALGELWRVAAIESGQVGPLLAMRRLTGVRAAMAPAVSAASPLVGGVEGPAIVRRQAYGVHDGEPFITWEYGGGRSLRHIVDRTREGGHLPIPTDQALAIAEKVASGLDQVLSAKVDGKRLLHGALIPQFVWVYEDGDVRVAGQYLNAGLLASLANGDIAREIGPYVAPEIRGAGTPTRATEVYSIGAIFYLVLTGQEPPDSASGQVPAAIADATLMEGGEPIPQEIRSILEKAMATDPAARFAGPAEVRQAIADILASGRYAPTTFNLAFYLHSLLRKEMEGEAVEREKESKVNPEPYIEEIAEELVRAAAPRQAPLAPAPPVPAAPEPPAPEPITAPAFGSSMQTPSRSKAPLFAVLALVVAGGAAGVWYVTKGKGAQPSQTAEAAPAAAPVQAPPPVQETPLEEPIVTEIPGFEEEAPQDDAGAARRRAIEDEVNRRMQDELRKLQEDHNRQLRAQQAAAQPVATPPQPGTRAAEAAPAPVPDRAAAPDPVTPAEPVAASALPAAAEPVAQQTAAPPPVTLPTTTAPVVREGDLVLTSDLDTQPQITRRVNPVYPPIAARQQITSFVIVSALVDEKGSVIDAKILKSDGRNFGFDEASLAAIRKFSFQPGTKNGMKVKTWHAVPFIFGKQQ